MEVVEDDLSEDDGGVDVSLEELDGDELEPLGGVLELELLLGLVDELLELGDVVVDELLLGSVELELELGVVVVELELGGVVVVVVVLLVPVLLRSQPVAATVARARTATRGISFFMTSPVSRAFERLSNPTRGPRKARRGKQSRPAAATGTPDLSRTRPCFSRRTVQDACQFRSGA